MYPGYQRPLNVLNEYAVTFFAMLNEGYRLRNERDLMLANIVILPHMDKKDSEAFLRKLSWAASNPDDILDSSGDASTPDEIRRFLGSA